MASNDAPASPEQSPALDLRAVRDGLEAAVAEAGASILEVRNQHTVRVGLKGLDGPVSEADHAADEVLHRRLIPLVAGVHWVSEESEQAEPLVRGEPTWVVDPLDGTREFLLGLPEFAVSAGLFVEDRLVLGAVWLPVLPSPRSAGTLTDGDVLSGLIDVEGEAGARGEARHNGEPLGRLDDDDAIGRVALSRWDFERRGVQHALGVSAYPSGSSAVKLAHVADRTASLYLSTRGRSLWDVAGGAAVVQAVGGALTGADGSPLSLSPQRMRVPPFVAGPRQRCLALLRRLGAAV